MALLDFAGEASATPPTVERAPPMSTLRAYTEQSAPLDFSAEATPASAQGAPHLAADGQMHPFIEDQPTAETVPGSGTYTPQLRPGEAPWRQGADFKPEPGALDFSQDASNTAPAMTGVATALAKGAARGAVEAKQSGQVLTGNRAPTSLPDETDPASAPVTWNDLFSPSDVASKLAYSTAKGSPTLAAGLAGAGAGGRVAGVPGAIAGGALGAGAASGFQALGPLFAAEVASGKKPDEAYDAAVAKAAQTGAFSAVGWGLFGWTPFKSFVKDLLLQSFAVQPAAAAVEKGVTNVEDGRPIAEGVIEGIPGSIVSTAIPAGAIHAIKTAFGGKVAPSASPSEDIDAFLARAHQAWTAAHPEEAYAYRTAHPWQIDPKQPRLPPPDGSTGPASPADAAPAPGRPAPKPGPTNGAPDASEGAAATPPPAEAAKPTEKPASAVPASEAIVTPPPPAKAETGSAVATIDRTHDVPGTAGISNDGKTVYVDSTIPKDLPVKKLDGTDTTIDPAPFLKIHEEEEQRQMEAGKSFQEAHNDHATPAEHSALKAAGIDAASYEAALKPHIDKLWGGKPQDLPHDLYRRPYTEQGVTPEGRLLSREKGTADFSKHAVPAIGDGTRANPAEINHPAALEAAGAHVDTKATTPQILAGNAKKAHVRLHGLDITIENPKGSVRSNRNPEGPRWSVKMPAAYGYVKRSIGADTKPGGKVEQVDVYVGDKPDSHRAFVVDQKDPKAGTFDEHKLMLGFASEAAARRTYEAGFSDGSGASRIQSITETTIGALKKWLRTPGGNMEAFAPAPKGSKAATATVSEKPAKTSTKPATPGKSVNAWQFVKAMGGVSDPTGELKSAGLIRQVPGLINKSGRHPDKVREALAEAGYFHADYGDPAGAVAKTTLADFYDLMRRGKEAFAQEDQEAVDTGKAEAQGEAQTAKAENVARSALTALIQEHGMNDDPVIVDRAVQLMIEGVTAEDAIEAASMEQVDAAAPDNFRDRIDTSLPGYFPDEVDVQGSSESGGAGERGGKEGQPEGPPSPEDRGVDTSRPGADAGGGGKPATERTEAGEQGVIPGAEQISSAELAKRKAAEGLKAKANQKPADEGLFGDGSQQTDLVDLAGKPAKKPASKSGEKINTAPKEAEPPQWAEVLHALPKTAAGRPDMDLAVRLMAEITGKPRPAFKSLDPGQKIELLKQARAAAMSSPKGVTLGSTVPREQTNTPAFRAWFGDSKVVDGEGKPVVVYHATNQSFDAFDPTKLGASTRHPTAKLGFYFSAEPKVAELFTQSVDDSQWPPKLVQRQGANLMPSYLSIKNPFEMSVETFRNIQGRPFGEEFEREQPEAAKKVSDWIASNKAALLARDHDGIHIKGDQKYADSLAGEEYSADAWVAFDPTQIKSATGNNGEFSGKNPSVIASTAARQARPFYSAVQRAVDAAKTAKASPSQWLATIKNTPGVKAEEIAWLGLEDWLKDQGSMGGGGNGAPTAITREAVADFVRANQVAVQEVHKAGRDDTGEGDSGRYEIERQPNGEWAVVDGYYGVPADVFGTEAEAKADLAARAANSPVKHDDYQLPGGEDYRELLLTLPKKESPKTAEARALIDRIHGGEFNSLDDEGRRAIYRQRDQLMAEARREEGDNFSHPHWDEPNVLAHVRFNTRTVGNRKVLFIEEVQSDWHQAGRKHGYLGDEPGARTIAQVDHDLDAILTELDSRGPSADDYAAWEKNPDLRDRHDALMRERTAIANRASDAVPDAPFKGQGWSELAMKRMVRYAAENGFDQIAWTPGDVQNERYTSDLRQRVKSVEWGPDEMASETEGAHTIIGIEAASGKTSRFYVNDRGVVQRTSRGMESANGKTIEDLLGKEIARQILEKRAGKVEGDNLFIGGEGMRGFYDKILPGIASKIGKRFGAKVGTVDLPETAKKTLTGYGKGGQPAISVWSMPITDAMRKSVVEEGQPLFRTAAPKVRLDPRQRENLERTLSNMISRMAGKDVEVRFVDSIDADIAGDTQYNADMAGYDEAKGGKPSATAGGSITLNMDGRAIITIALGDPNWADPKTSTYHEIWHRVAAQLMNDSERAAMLAQAPRIRDYAAASLGLDPNSAAAQALPIYEAEAIANEEYNRRRDSGETIGETGLPPIIARIFERLRRLFATIKKMLNGRGYTRFEDIFEAAREGKFADRKPGFRDIQQDIGNTIQRGTEAFKKWFGESQVVDRDGAPLVVYHGSNRNISRFRPSPGMRHGDQGAEEVVSPAFFFTPDRDSARMFARDRVLIDQRLRGQDGGRPQTKAVYLSIQNPLDFTDGMPIHGRMPGDAALDTVEGLVGYRPETWQDVQRALDDPDLVDRLRDAGFDGAHLREDDGSRSWAAFDATQIKSATSNTGAFNPTNPSILGNTAGRGESPIVTLGNRAERAERRATKAEDNRVITGTEDALHALQTNSDADKLSILKAVAAMPKWMRNAAMQEKFYHHIETPALVPLNAREQAGFNEHVQPLLDKQTQLHEILRGLDEAVFQDTSVDMEGQTDTAATPNYIHRIRKDRRANEGAGEGAAAANPIFGTRSLSQTAPSMKSRTMLGISSNGERAVISTGRAGLMRWENGHATPIRVTGDVGKIKVGKTIKIGGRIWRVVQATTAEIEEHSNVRYHKNAVVNTMDNLARLARAIRNVELLNAIKEDPAFRHLAIKDDGRARIPAGWEAVSPPQLMGWKVEPRLAHAIDDYYKGAKVIGGRTGDVLRGLNKIAIGSLFWSPVPHIANILGHWVVARGFDNITPAGMKSIVVDLPRALKSVTTHDQHYIDALRRGGSLIHAGFANRDFYTLMLKKMGNEIAANPNRWVSFAKAVGMSPVTLVRAIYNASSHALWWSGDVLMMHRYMELVRKGYSVDAAIAEAERHIPNYRIPSTVMGTRVISELMQDSAVTLFGRYHYGQIASYGHMLNDLLKGMSPAERLQIGHTDHLAIGQSGTSGPGGGRGPGFGSGGHGPSHIRVHALGSIIALGLLVIVLQPALKKLAKWITGNDNADAIARGPVSVPQAMMDVESGKKSFLQALAGVMTPNPVLKEVYDQFVTGKDSFTGKDIAAPGGSAAQQIIERAIHAFETPIAVVRQLEDFPKALKQNIGISEPSDKSLAYQQKYGPNSPRARKDAAKQAGKEGIGWIPGVR